MKIEVVKSGLDVILPFRNLFLQETNFQIRYDACHERNWSDSYLIMLDGVVAGYGSVKGKDSIPARDAIFEYYLLPACRKYGRKIFGALLSVSGARFIECQSNDFLLSSMLYEHAADIQSGVMLFREHITTNLKAADAIFREKRDDDSIFEHTLEPVGNYVVESHGEVVATGGFMTHYNPPFADLYMEVRKDFRRKGLGSFLLQEVKKHCYLDGRVPAGRCNIDNLGSRGALIKAGLAVSGYMLTGIVKQQTSPS
jgi:GNAT superfamily N-acetyltransferase